MAMNSTEAEIKEQVRRHYAKAAKGVSQGDAACCDPQAADPISVRLYEDDDLRGIPLAARLASLGCGNPVALAELHPGEVVLDLGSGGGIDVLLSARRVGPAGRAYGLDMTDEMLNLARENQRQAGVTNAEFLKGEMEAMPLPDGSVDVIISNCVVNLSPEKDRVFAEAFRVLRPGGRLAISDIVLRGALPEGVRRSAEAWAGCVAGALREEEYVAKLRAAGFADVTVEVTRTYSAEELCTAAAASGFGLSAEEASQAAGSIVSAFVRARKPRN